MQQCGKHSAPTPRQAVRGCLLGGAAGDALGYQVEFRSDADIRRRFGPGGIRAYQCDPESGKTLISDDTQMSLFTAAGLLAGGDDPVGAVYDAYLDWLETQTGRPSPRRTCPLLKVEALHASRAPGTTCMASLRSGRRGSVAEPINHSKGCGGIMRVAPLALWQRGGSLDALARTGAELAAITHGHPLGWLPAAALVCMLAPLVRDPVAAAANGLRAAVEDGLRTTAAVFAGTPYLPDLLALCGQAIDRAGNGRPDRENIRALGEGWVAEETLAIAVYCALRHAGDFSGGIIAAVNHDGDSDSTGAVAGNLLGAWLGMDAIGAEWRRDLELADLVLRMADALYAGGAPAQV